MEYNENEMVTVSLERYDQMKEDLESLASEVEKWRGCFSIEESKDNKRVVFVDRERLDVVVKEQFEGKNLLGFTFPVTEVKWSKK